MFDLVALTLPAELHQLRREVRAFLSDELATGRIAPHCDQWLTGWDPEFSRRLGARGWIGMSLPKQYGGSAAGALARFVVTEELLAAGAPVAAHWMADRQSGPALLSFGTEEQRTSYLPGIARGEVFFAIGMSEPDTGSDLASVRTRGERVGGGWVIRGTKVWTGGAHRAHALVVLARTTPAGEDRHSGLTQFIIDLPSDRVRVRPIRLLTGEHHFNEVVLDEVFVPDSRVLGIPGRGWLQVTHELAMERSGPERILSTYPLLAAAVGELRRGAAMSRAADNACLGGLVARLWALRQMSLAVAGRLEAGEAPAVPAAVVKDLGTRFEGALAETIRLLTRTVADSAATQQLARMLAESVLHSPGFTLRGGANEILRGVIARGLGLR
jgi:alkylation response protein AidB-like acyl-CoA dehydrogenase